MCIGRRISDALGHSRGRRCHDSTLAAKGKPASSLWGSGDLLLLLQPSSGVPRPAHVARSPHGRCELARRPERDGFHRLATSGGEGEVSGPYHCTHLLCRRTSLAHRSIGSRLAADLHRHVEPSPVLPVAARKRCALRLWSRSDKAHDLPRSSGLADGRVGHHRETPKVRFILSAKKS